MIIIYSSCCIASEKNQNSVTHVTQFLARCDSNLRTLNNSPEINVENSIESIHSISLENQLHLENVKVAREMGVVFPDRQGVVVPKKSWSRFAFCLCASNSAVISSSEDN